MRRFSKLTWLAAACLWSSLLGAAEPDLKALVKDLQATKPVTREQAAAALGNLGPGAVEAVPALAEALKDKDARVRHEALIALERIGAAAAEDVHDLQGLV